MSWSACRTHMSGLPLRTGQNTHEALRAMPWRTIPADRTINKWKYQKPMTIWTDLCSPLPPWLPIWMPINVISAVAVPISLSLRLFANVLSGTAMIVRCGNPNGMPEKGILKHPMDIEIDLCPARQQNSMSHTLTSLSLYILHFLSPCRDASAGWRPVYCPACWWPLPLPLTGAWRKRRRCRAAFRMWWK